ncbi:MAG TPA: hypothetical protein VGD67_13405 [Pseudonocardiaceae bacterium]
MSREFLARREEARVHIVRLAPPPSLVAADLAACLRAIGAGDEVLGGVALLGLSLPGFAPVLDAVLVTPRGVLVVTGVDLPDPAVRLDAPIDGPWLVDGWRLRLPGGADNPVPWALAATSAVAVRLQRTGGSLPEVHTVVAVGPYAGTVVRPDGDAGRGLHVLAPSTRGLVHLATGIGDPRRRAGAAGAAGVLRILAPTLRPTAADLRAEGFA